MKIGADDPEIGTYIEGLYENPERLRFAEYGAKSGRFAARLLLILLGGLVVAGIGGGLIVLIETLIAATS
jgi:hypothetical protein